MSDFWPHPDPSPASGDPVFKSWAPPPHKQLGGGGWVVQWAEGKTVSRRLGSVCLREGRILDPHLSRAATIWEDYESRAREGHLREPSAELKAASSWEVSQTGSLCHPRPHPCVKAPPPVGGCSEAGTGPR